MAKITVSAISRKQMPSKYGGQTWEIIKIKIQGKGDEIYEIQGFGKNEKQNLKAGSVLTGYFSERSWSGQNGVVVTKTFNKISAEYVYDLLLKQFPNIEAGGSGVLNTPVSVGDDWDTGGAPVTPVAEEDPGF